MHDKLNLLLTIFKQGDISIHIKNSDKDQFYFFVEQIWKLNIEKSPKSESYYYLPSINRIIPINLQFIPPNTIKQFFFSLNEYLQSGLDHKDQIICDGRIIEKRGGYISIGSFNTGLIIVLSPFDLKNINMLQKNEN